MPLLVFPQAFCRLSRGGHAPPCPDHSRSPPAGRTLRCAGAERCSAPSHARPHPAILPPMTSRDSASSEITPEVLLRAYACGIFPMAESAEDPTLFWVEPGMRGVIPLDRFRISSPLARTVRSEAFTVTASS